MAREPVGTADQRSEQRRNARWLVVAAAFTIGLGLLWMSQASTWSLFFATFGDCFENCEDFFRRRANDYNFLTAAGYGAVVIGVLAVWFRPAQLVLLTGASLALLSVAAQFVLPDMRDWVVPGVDVHLGAITIAAVPQLPALILFLIGGSVAFVAARMRLRSRAPELTP